MYRNNFLLFAGIAALVAVLVLATQLLAVAAGVPPDYESYKAREASLTNGTALLFILESVILLLISLIAVQLSYGATVYGVSMVHMGKRTTIRESFESIRPFWSRLLGVSFLIGLRMAGIGILVVISLFFGYAAFIILPFVIWWGVYVYARCSLASAACVLEGSSAGASIKRSHFLATNGTWRIFLTLLLTGILNAALGYALRVPAEILRAHLGQSSLMVMVSKPLSDFFAQILTGPIEAIALVLIYYDQRIRKEAFDLQLMMQALEPTGVPQSAKASSPIG